jgi:hypothetical protein
MEGRITTPGTAMTEVRNQTGLNDDEARAFHGYFITGSWASPPLPRSRISWRGSGRPWF